MKCFILLYLVVLIFADDDIAFEDFGLQGISPARANGTVSELTPYMASLRLLSEDANTQYGFGHFCGGVFISRKHVLTLASCLQRTNRIIYSYELQVVAGRRYRYDSTDANILSAKFIVIHPDYNTTDELPNNLAIIILSDEVSPEMTTIVPIRVADKKADINENFQIFGWGIPLTNSSNRELQTGRITVTDRNVCASFRMNRFCAGPSYYGGCQGDDGGAVAVNGQLYGLVDYRSSQYCSETKAAHLYVDVYEYRDWIASVISNDTTSTTTPSVGNATQSYGVIILTIIALFTLKNIKQLF